MDKKLVLGLLAMAVYICSVELTSGCLVSEVGR